MAFSPFFFSILLSGMGSDFFRPRSTFTGLWEEKERGKTVMVQVRVTRRVTAPVSRSPRHNSGSRAPPRSTHTPQDCREAQPQCNTPRICPCEMENSRVSLNTFSSPSRTGGTAQPPLGAAGPGEPHGSPIPTPGWQLEWPCPQRKGSTGVGRGDADLLRGFSSARPLFSF